MSNTVLALHEIISRLDETQLDALYKVAVCFDSQNSFDDFTLEESEAINQAFEEIRRGDCVSFNSAEKMAEHFEII